MSSIARWTYTDNATVTPRIGIDGVTGIDTYGMPYTIKCNVTAITSSDIKPTGGAATGIDGDEWIGTHTIYTEDDRPRKGDLISFDGSDGAQIIRDRTFWSMTAFGATETPDFKLIT